MIQKNKEERKYIILGHIVDEYVYTAQPVSSKSVVARMGGNISSATIRNVMARLEDEGYIGQPHTSAGRVPTNIGYRSYVDQLKEHIRFERRQTERLAYEYNRRIRTIKDVLDMTSRLISSELKNAGLVLWPNIADFHLKRLELIQLNAETALAVLVTMTNAVKNHIIKLDETLQNIELSQVANYVNDNFENSPFMEISGSIRGKKEVEDASEEKCSSAALTIVEAIIDTDIENEISWEGFDYFMDEPEFQNAEATRRIFKTFSDRKELVRLMRSDISESGIKIRIGQENESEGLCECSIVTSGYTLHGKTAGRIGVIGPTRMDYAHALSTITFLSDVISKKLETLDS